MVGPTVICLQKVCFLTRTFVHTSHAIIVLDVLACVCRPYGCGMN